MSDTQFVLIGENTLEVAFVMEVNREMNDHAQLYGRYKPNQHDIGSISGLTEALAGIDTKEGNLEDLTTDNKENLVRAINEVDLHADNNATNLSNHIADKNNPHKVTKAQVGLGNCDNTSDLNKPISTATQTALDNITNGTTSIAYDNTTSGLSATTLQGAIDEIDSDLDNVEDLIPSAASASNKLTDKSYVDTADNDLQSQIDAIEAKSDVTDIVGTYAELEDYDTSKLTDGDVIKVLQDETQNDAITYYRWVVTGGTGAFELIGSEGPYYTVAETDTLLGAKQNTIDSTHKLDSDLVDDSGQTNKFVTSAEKTQISTNASNITALQTDKANVSLDNLNADGQMIIDSQNGTISNCILEIPQNLKLEISGTTFTAKTGSIISIAGSTYSTVTLTADLTRNLEATTDGKYVIFYQNGIIRKEQNLSYITSGDTASMPESFDTNTVYFNTDDKLIYYHTGSGHDAQVWVNCSYPLCILELNNGIWSFAKDSHGNDIIFNGTGFIGHHSFVYPNVKALIPIGFNEDGSLKSKEVTIDSLRIVELGNTKNSVAITGYSAQIGVTTFGNELNRKEEIDDIATYHYIKSENLNYVRDNASAPLRWREEVNFVNYQYDGTTVTDFAIEQPVRLATTEMLDEVQDQVDSNTAAISGKQDALVSGTNIKTINSTTVLGSGDFTLADQSLSNLDSTGQMVIDSQNGTISNCILDIPQNIKVTLENNVYTLKAGSTRVRFGKTFATVTNTEDLTLNIDVSTDGRFVIIGVVTHEDQLSINEFSSGETLPETKTTTYFWNVIDKLLYHWVISANSYQPFSTWCYPSCLIDVANGVASFAKDNHGNDMIFNGAGFIGHHAFVYPNVTVLYPWGYTDDKHLNSVSVTTGQLYIIELATNRNSLNITGHSTPVSLTTRGADLNLRSEVTDTNIYHYIISENYICSRTSGGVVNRPLTPFVGYTYDGTTVTKFDTRQPYESARNLLTDNIEAEVSTKQVDVTTLTGYDSTQTQTLKNINGVLTWVTD